MIEFDHVTAIAVIGDVRPRNRKTERAVAVAAITSIITSDTIGFTLASHVVRSPKALQNWIGDVLADDPVLVGHRLPRISRLLRGAGLDYNLCGSFRADARHDVAEISGGRMVPLVVSALDANMLAVDERALAARWGPPCEGHVLAGLATINAVATWALFVHRIAHGRNQVLLRERELTRLAQDLVRGGATTVLTASVAPSIH